MKWIAFILSLCVTVSAFSQKDKAAAYIAQYKDIAIDEMLRSGVPAAITLAQGMLESQYGESDLSRQSNNHFGIKCKNDWTGEKVYHDDDMKGECFRSYVSVADSYKDHSDFLRTRPHYAFLFQLAPTDYEGWAKGLKKAGYATESNYPQMLMKVINDYNLNQYTLLALQKKNGNNDSLTMAATKPIVDSITNAPVSQTNAVVEADLKKESDSLFDDSDIVEKVKPAFVPTVEKQKQQQSLYPDSTIFTINHIRVIYAKAGTSLLSIAERYDISLGKLLDFNDMEETDILPSPKLIFIEKKAKRGAKDFHVVEETETLHDISQKEGVRLTAILEYNGLKKNTQLSLGQKIYLKAMTSVPKTTVATNTSTAVMPN